MKSLTLLRHAKSDWSDASQRDFDRPINERGQRGAKLIGSYLKREAMAFDAVVASPAVRVVETIDLLEQGYGTSLKPDWDRRIYLASSVTLIDLLSGLDDAADRVLMVGHNPGLEDLIFDLVPDDGTSPLRDEVEIKFPTAALAVLELDIDSWKDIDNRCARLVSLMRPRDLDPALGPQMD
ncbi:MAG: histidine phosphatase family protein [Blastomonas sp.]